ncbi:MraY family glycosyltransferase [Rubrolithibacter danxiaensis]|uniref:MraY family glycosyltransferase n=1 Tax=Rubrolithibacter danxiaensis TaxID=3390805 RepID=UPI003BF7FACF
MPEVIKYISFLFLFFILEILYFRIAGKYKIIDIPNDRSSHKKFTIRGGGIIFSIAAICWFLLSGFQAPFFIAGLTIISVVSFIDDLEHIHTKIRFVFQLLAVALMLFQLPMEFEWFWFPVIFLLLVGTINAYNFMDGINGITGLYSIATLLSLLWINTSVGFTDSFLIILTLLSVCVFGFFNFRRKAICFAGDIGSVSIAFILCFLIINLVIKTGNIAYILILLVYGLDAGTTILFRLVRGENIFEAHRSHFYQYLANERKWSHLSVSLLFAGVQVLFNILLITGVSKSSSVLNIVSVVGIILVFTGVFIYLRIKIQGKEQLFHSTY